MIYLDFKTAIVNTFFTDLVSLFVMIIIWRQVLHRFDGIGYLVVSFLFQVICYLLLILRGQISDFLSIDASNTLAVMGALLALMGLERFTGKKSNQIHNYIVIVLFFLIHCYFTYIQPSLNIRILNVSVGLFLFSAQSAWLLIIRVPRNLRIYTFNVGIVFILICSINLVRISFFFINTNPNNDFLNSGNAEVFAVISLQLSLIILTFALFLMINRRLLGDIALQEEKFSKAFYSVPYAIIITSLKDGKIIEVNDGFYTITKYSHPDVVGSTTLGLSIWVNNQDRDWLINSLENNQKVVEKEFQFRRKTGEILIGLITAELILINNEICILSVVNDITERKLAEEKLKQSEEQLKKFATHLQNVQEEEKIVLASQLDNELGQNLVALKMDVGLFKKKVLKGFNNKESEEVFNKLDQTYNSIGKSLSTTLRMMDNLRSEVLYLMGIIEAINIYSDEFEVRNHIKCEFVTTLTALSLDKNQETSLFRIFQNGMSNIAEHSKATAVKINLYLTDNKLVLKIEDNGIGFEPKVDSKSSGTGLLFMDERAKLLGGELIVNSVINKGTTLIVEIPYTI